ncbi:hypothetical protein V6N13_096778 [Hibiscus sabdariffa]
MGLQRVVLESDNKSVIWKQISHDFDRFEIGPIIRDVKEMVVFFRGCRFTFAGRQSNSLMHALAAKGLRHNSDRFWVKEAPTLVDHLAAQDR